MTLSKEVNRLRVKCEKADTTGCCLMTPENHIDSLKRDDVHAYRERAERAHKIPVADTLEDKTNLTLPSSTSSIKFLASVSVQDIEVLDRSVTTVNEEPGGAGYSDSRLLEKPGATAKLTGDYADSFLIKELKVPDANQKSHSFLNEESEIPDDNQKSYSVSKERLALLGKSASLFDAKFADAELDALLDMLDNKTAGQAPS